MEDRDLFFSAEIFGTRDVFRVTASGTKGIRPHPEVLGCGLGRCKQYDVKKTVFSPKNTDRKMNFKNTSVRREQKEAGAEATDSRAETRSSALLARLCAARGGGR